MKERGEGHLMTLGITQGLSGGGGVAVEMGVKALRNESNALVDLSAVLWRQAGDRFVSKPHKRQKQR